MAFSAPLRISSAWARPPIASCRASIIIVYIGHPGGQEECEALEGFISSLDINLYQAVRLSFYNRSAKTPIVIVIEKAGVNDEKQPATKDY
jgi:hypothetical protein